jgi:hypothetical protein
MQADQDFLDYNPFILPTKGKSIWLFHISVKWEI